MDSYSYIDANLHGEQTNTDYHGEAPRYTDAHYAAVLKAEGPIDPRALVRPLTPPGRHRAGS